MSHRNTSARPRAAVVVGLVAGLAALLLAPSAMAAQPEEGEVTVMTRNVYLGADLGPILDAVDLPGVLAAATAAYNQVIYTDFPQRAKLLAKEIKKKKPDIVGVQEAAAWFADVDPPTTDGDATPATHVEYDFRADLEKQLKKKKAKYTVVRAQRELDGELPTFSGDRRLVMRDLMLVRKGVGASVKFEQSKNFDNFLTVLGGAVDVDRGWIAGEANVRGTEFRVVNTHLEAFDSGVRLDQADELVAPGGPADADAAGMPVVLLGDLNTDDEIEETLGASPEHADDELPYAALTGAGLEERSVDGPNLVDDEFSCCFFDPDIDDPDAYTNGEWDHNVDHIMVSDGAITLVKSSVTGNSRLVDSNALATPHELWASDHGGVVSTLQFPLP
ncbi:MAG: hypothetical protein ABI726_05980 [bacterium]